VPSWVHLAERRLSRLEGTQIHTDDEVARSSLDFKSASAEIERLKAHNKGGPYPEADFCIGGAERLDLLD
jgi:hypothetical protein